MLYALLAAIAYAVFAAFGLAVWFTLLFVAEPHSANPVGTLLDLFATSPTRPLLAFHACFTVASSLAAVLLFFNSRIRGHAALIAAFASALAAVAAWVVFHSDTALLPSVAAVALAVHYMKLRSSSEA